MYALFTRKPSARRPAPLPALLAAATALLLVLTTAGCTPRLAGKYSDAAGAMTLDFQSGNRAQIITPLGTLTTEYHVSGDKVTLKYQGEDLVLTRNSDGSLDGPAGRYTKQ
jgi:hypothetical protein